ncbi:U3 small nucleolar RNA-associated protein 18 homolog [Anopheles funestus]|uniref:U3 small nucleolar RNA-associated protein 18 homolog n=1 Tax=Anopheles funestus TaxID=62324 RepID=UPI0020C5BD7E|nr:U3 small nucleolar RNA-associated protein 18 homolog [Anopheles funestus]
MESDDDFGHLTSNLARDLQTKTGQKDTVHEDDKSSSEDEKPSIKSESDEDEVVPTVAAHTFDDASIKSEPESQSDDNLDHEALISSYVRALKSKMGYKNAASNESSDEDNIKSEPETGDDENQTRNQSNAGKDQNMESSEIAASAKKGGKSPEKVKKKLAKKLTNKKQIKPKMQKKSKNHAKAVKEVKIDKPTSKKEKMLMSLVFGGKAAFVSQLSTQEKQKEKTAPATQPNEDKLKTGDKRNQKRSAIWHDSDDDDEEDSSNMKRNKFSQQELPGQVTKQRRRNQFEQIVGKPKWADLDRVKEVDSDDEILQTVGHVVKGPTAQGLPKGTIELKRLKDLSRDVNNKGEICSIMFHPTSMVAIIVGKGGLVSIVAVDGVQNEKLHTIGLKKTRLTCASLSPDGNEVIFGSYRKTFHIYDLISGHSESRKIPDKDTLMMNNFRASRCGKYLASAGEFGEVHLMSAISKDVLQLIQLSYTCSSLAFTPDSKYLLCHSTDTKVSVFCLQQKRVVNVFQDDGCVNGSCIAICPNGQYVATGSRQGIVNIYTMDATLTQQNPVPLKTINNLTTFIDSLSFNATSEILLIASSTVKNAARLIHVKSGTVFRNFPVQMSGIGMITAAEFSPSGGYLALGTRKSKVSLFRVKYYPNY